MQRFLGRGIVPWDQYFSFKAVFQKFTQARLVLIPAKICDGRCASPWRDKARLTAYVRIGGRGGLQIPSGKSVKSDVLG